MAENPLLDAPGGGGGGNPSSSIDLIAERNAKRLLKLGNLETKIESAEEHIQRGGREDDAGRDEIDHLMHSFLHGRGSQEGVVVSPEAMVPPKSPSRHGPSWAHDDALGVLKNSPSWKPGKRGKPGEEEAPGRLRDMSMEERVGLPDTMKTKSHYMEPRRL